MALPRVQKFTICLRPNSVSTSSVFKLLKSPTTEVWSDLVVPKSRCVCLRVIEALAFTPDGWRYTTWIVWEYGFRLTVVELRVTEYILMLSLPDHFSDRDEK